MPIQALEMKHGKQWSERTLDQPQGGFALKSFSQSMDQGLVGGLRHWVPPVTLGFVLTSLRSRSRKHLLGLRETCYKPVGPLPWASICKTRVGRRYFYCADTFISSSSYSHQFYSNTKIIFSLPTLCAEKNKKNPKPTKPFQVLKQILKNALKLLKWFRNGWKL